MPRRTKTNAVIQVPDQPSTSEHLHLRQIRPSLCTCLPGSREDLSNASQRDILTDANGHLSRSQGKEFSPSTFQPLNLRKVMRRIALLWQGTLL